MRLHISLCICAYVHVFLYFYTYIYIYVSVYIYIYTYIYLYLYLYLYLYMRHNKHGSLHGCFHKLGVFVAVLIIGAHYLGSILGPLIFSKLPYYVEFLLWYGSLCYVFPIVGTVV